MHFVCYALIGLYLLVVLNCNDIAYATQTVVGLCFVLYLSFKILHKS